MAALHALDRSSRVGISLNLNPVHPATASPEDAAAARRLDGYFNRWYLDPLHGRGYPADLVEWYGELLDPQAVAEMGDYDGDLDFLGINYYSRRVVRASSNGLLSLDDVRIDGSLHTNTGWEVYPQGLSEVLQRVAKEYGPKAIYVTENGASFDDQRENGHDAFNDKQRRLRR